jgi:hypothetical protein
MPIQIQWDDPQQSCIYTILTAPFDLNDWYNAVAKTCIMLNSVQHPVNIILDVSLFDHLPMKLIDALNTCKPRYHANQYAQIAIVGERMVIPMQTLLDEAELMQGTAVVSSLVEANRILDEMRMIAV